MAIVVCVRVFAKTLRVYNECGAHLQHMCIDSMVSGGRDNDCQLWHVHKKKMHYDCTLFCSSCVPSIFIGNFQFTFSTHSNGQVFLFLLPRSMLDYFLAYTLRTNCAHEYEKHARGGHRATCTLGVPKQQQQQQQVNGQRPLYILQNQHKPHPLGYYRKMIVACANTAHLSLSLAR